MSQDAKHSRRKFLKNGMAAAGATLPIAALCDAIYNSFLRTAYAEVSGASTAPRNYINVAALSAPCRYAFDHWVRVNDSDAAIIPNPMVSTKLTGPGDRYNDVAYETFKMSNSTANGILVPSFFKGSVTTTAGAQQLTDLANNMLVIRGYGTNIDGHPGNHQTQLTPINGAPSISGAVADAGNFVFPAVQYPTRAGYTVFASAAAKGLATVGDPALQQLMSAFGPTTSTSVAAVKAAHANTINYYESRLKALAQSSDSAAQSLAINVENARKLMKRGVNDIQNYWQGAVDRYTNVIQSNLRASGIAGVNDMQVVNSQGAANLVTSRDNLFHYQTADNQDGFYVVAPSYDLRQSLASAVMPQFAEGLALAEYLILQNLGGVLEIQLPYIFGVSAQVFTDSTQSATKDAPSFVSHDMHFTGGVSTVLYTNALFRAFSAGIMELAAKLKGTASANGGNLWQDTVIHLTGDFGRIARSDGTGSDHGFNQMVSSVYSGLIAAPMVVGNVQSTGMNDAYAGSQGLGAAIDNYSQAGRPTPVMMASTVAELLRLPANPYRNLADPLVRVVNGQANYASYGQGKTVG